MDEAERLCDRVAIVDHGRVIALGTPRELIASLDANQIVFFAVEGGEATLAAADLAAIGGEAGAKRAPRAADGGWELQVDAPHVAIPTLRDALPRHGVKLTELRTHSPTLEDVFVALTGRALRDG